MAGGFFGIGRNTTIPHYHGDRVRELFLAVAILSFVAIPLWGDLLPFGLLVQIASGLLLVILAGVTNPHSKIVMLINVLVAAAGAFLLEVTAIQMYASQSSMLFVIREVAVILFLYSLYSSVKTLRAMVLGKVGQGSDRAEFQKRSPWTPKI